MLSLPISRTFFLIYWLIPRILGEPFLRLVRMVEHTGKDETADMIHNTRTSFPSVFLKFLYWNMPYHIEHHLYSSVPFYNLPKFHKLIKNVCEKNERGVFHNYAKFIIMQSAVIAPKIIHSNSVITSSVTKVTFFKVF